MGKECSCDIFSVSFIGSSCGRQEINQRLEGITKFYREYAKWLANITDIYLVICDSKTGGFKFLPFEDGALDWPYRLQVLKLVQLNYRKHLIEHVLK